MQLTDTFLKKQGGKESALKTFPFRKFRSSRTPPSPAADGRGCPGETEQRSEREASAVERLRGLIWEVLVGWCSCEVM